MRFHMVPDSGQVAGRKYEVCPFRVKIGGCTRLIYLCPGQFFLLLCKCITQKTRKKNWEWNARKKEEPHK